MPLPSLLLLNKPFRVLTQFTSEDGKATLRDFVHAPGMRPAGRLDYDSEGLVLLTDSGTLQTQLADPRWKQGKTYFVQVEGEIDEPALAQLRRGVTLNDGPTLPAEAERVDEPEWLWPRDPPIRFRKEIPTSWLRLTIREGRNRQVRRMTAAVSFPTLRLIRYGVGPWTVAGLAPGESRQATASEVEAFLTSGVPKRNALRAGDIPWTNALIGGVSKKDALLAGGASRPPRSRAGEPQSKRSTQRRSRTRR